MYIVQMIDSLHTGGAQKLVVMFAREAVKRGYKTAVISLSFDDNSIYKQQFLDLGVPVFFFPTKRVFDFSNIKRLLSLFRRERPELIHAHLTYATLLSSIVSIFLRIPVVATLHSTGVDPLYASPRTEKLEELALQFIVKKVIACGPSVEKYFAPRMGKKEILTIANAILPITNSLSDAEIAEIKTKISGDAARPLILSVGRLAIQKGFAELLQTMGEIQNKGLPFFLAIAGDGEEREALERKICDLNLQKHVAILGRRDDIPDLLLSSDVFVLASHWEGLPMAVLEAMSAGLPILATDVGDIAWAVGESGVIVQPNEPRQLLAGLLDILDHPHKRKIMSDIGKKRVDELFNPLIWFDRIMLVYLSILPEKNRLESRNEAK